MQYVKNAPRCGFHFGFSKCIVEGADTLGCVCEDYGGGHQQPAVVKTWLSS
jgi:hypothetical protein